MAVPNSAAAADGHAFYSWGDPANPQQTKLEDPDSRVCLEVAEVEAGKSKDAWKFKNWTSSKVMLFSEGECTGTRTDVGVGGDADPNVKFRSLYFS
ncbi:hypothetical protein ACH4SP_07230 [Streptomyces sp. NPDC021093]|uniref:hypothetical protein n=1 Tax=Streptomyces sp. NPDC021093 TaxID=3365112 RepID=UPI0037A2D5D3